MTMIIRPGETTRGAAFLHLSKAPSEIEYVPVRRSRALDIPAELLHPGEYCKV